MATFLRCLYLPFSMGSIRKRNIGRWDPRFFAVVLFGSIPPPNFPYSFYSTFPTSLFVFILSVWQVQPAYASWRERGGGVRAKQYDSKKRVGLLQFIPSTNGLFLQKCASCCLLASSMSMVAMTEVRKGGSVPNTSRQFALIKENFRVRTRSFFVPNTRRKFALTKENFRIRTRSFFVPITRRQFALTKENFWVKTRSFFVSTRRMFALIKDNPRGVSRTKSTFQRRQFAQIKDNRKGMRTRSSSLEKLGESLP